MPTPLLLLLSRGGRIVPKRYEGWRETYRPLSRSNLSDENGRHPIAHIQPLPPLAFLSISCARTQARLLPAFLRLHKGEAGVSFYASGGQANNCTMPTIPKLGLQSPSTGMKSNEDHWLLAHSVASSSDLLF